MAELAERFPGLSEDVVGELASISRLHSLNPEELYFKWESYNMKMGGENTMPDLKTVRDFKKDVQDVLERETRGKIHGRAVDRKTAGATPRNARTNNADDIFDGMAGVVATPRIPMAGVNGNSQKRRSTFETPASKAYKAHAESSPADTKIASGIKDAIPFSARSNPGQVDMSLNDHIDVPQKPSAPADPRIKLRANVELNKFAYKNMAVKLSEASEVLDDRIETFLDIVKKHHNLDDSVFGNPTRQSTSEIVAVGRIACDSPTGKLAATSVVLETSRRMGAGVRVPLKLDLVDSYDLFPGKIVAVRGSNASGEYFSVAELLEIPLQYSAAPDLAVFDETSARLGEESPTLNVIVAAGPFTSDANLDFEPLQAICDRAAESMADALILVGPFLDTEHPLVASGDFPSIPNLNPDTATLTDVFRSLVAVRLQKLIQSVPSITILMVPSVRDVINKHASFPQDRMNRKLLGLPKQCSVVTNPVTISLNETIFTISSQDVLYELKRQECVKMAANSKISESLGRMSRQLLEQRHVFPIYPPISRDSLPRPTLVEGAGEAASEDNKAIGAMLDISYLGLGEIPNVRPDVLITPSSLSPFAKVVESVVVVNPGPLSKKRAAGTYAQMYIQPRVITDEERSAGAPVGTRMFERARVDVVRI